MRSENTNSSEQGQATVALVGVLTVLGIAAVALSWVGEAMVHRAAARNAADAVALAVAADPDEGESLASWYQSRGITIEHHDDQIIAASGPARAASRAVLSAEIDQASPVLQAIVARAEQLTGHMFSSARWDQQSVDMSIGDGVIFALVAVEFGLCPAADNVGPVDQMSFTWC